MIGKTLGHYQITEKLGEGGMGVVYKARDLHLDRFVALKILPSEKVADSERKRRFVQEAKAASALNHPNVVHVYDIDLSDGTDYIAMEYVEGKTLDRQIGHRGLRLSDALKYAVQIADALAKAHSAGIVHRDLKPTNVMVNEDGVVKVLDFGLAKLTEQIQGGESASTATIDDERRPITEEGVIVGTVSYMSPEQVEGMKVDARSDVFSLGSVLYEMLTGQKAFQGTSKMSTLSAILHQEPKPVTTIIPAIPADLEKLINRCLRKDPAKRFQHMDDVRVALNELKEDSESERLQSTPAASKQITSKRFVTGAVAVVALIALTVAGWYWLSRQRGAEPEAPLTAVPLTAYPGYENWPSFSPDGSQVAFAWNGEKEDNWDIYVKLVGSESCLRLTNSSAVENSPAWSPDGRQIAFCRDLGAGKGAVILISPLGGPEQILTEFSYPGGASRLAWSPDGRALAMVEVRGELDTKQNLALYALETGVKQSLFKNFPSSFFADNWPIFSPDGRALAFCRWAGYGISDLYLLDLSRDLKPVGEPRRITFQNLSFSGAAWLSDGSSMVYSAGGNLWKVVASGSGQPQKLAFIGQDAYNPAYSQRASRLAYTHSTSDVNIWRAELSSPQGKADPPTKFISSTRNDRSPQYSPDGTKIAFASERSGSWEIWVCDADGSDALQLTRFGKGDTDRPQWSPDSRRLAFHSTVEGHPEVYIMNASGGNPRRRASSSGSQNPSWSRDGRWIYFDSPEGIKRVPAEGGQAVLVNVSPPGWGPIESEDGKSIYFIDARGTTEADFGIWRGPLEGGESRQILDSFVVYGGYAITDDGIYFIARPDPAKGYSIRFLELATGRINTIAELGRQPCGNLAISPDRRWALYYQQDQAGSDLMLVENFR